MGRQMRSAPIRREVRKQERCIAFNEVRGNIPSQRVTKNIEREYDGPDEEIDVYAEYVAAFGE